MNSGHMISIQEYINMEYDVACYYMTYIAFGFKFSGKFSELIELNRDIENVMTGWGYLHRN